MTFMPPIEWLKERFYICEAGILRHRKARGRAKANDPVGTMMKDGYVKTNVLHDGVSKKLAVHRIVYSLKTGVPVPDDVTVDHRNKVRSNNRPGNLRLATGREQNLNRCVKGFGATRSGKRWKSKISVHGRTIHLGSFDRKSDAVAAYRQARKGEHPKVPVELLDGLNQGFTNAS